MTDTNGFEFPRYVNFDNLDALRRQGERQIDEGKNSVFSLGSLEEGSSAAVALMIALFRYAHRQGKSIRFVEIPAALHNIIEVSELTRVLPLEAAVADAPGNNALVDREAE